MVQKQTWLWAVAFVLLAVACVRRGDTNHAAEPVTDAPTIEPQVHHTIKCMTASATFTFSRNGKRFAVSDGGEITVWDTKTWKQVGTLSDKEERGFNYVLLSPEGKVLGITSRERKDIKLLEVETGKLLRTLTGHRAYIVSPTFSPDGKTIVATDSGDDLRLWDVEAGKDLERFTNKPEGSGSERHLSFSPDSAVLAVATQGATIHLLDISKGSEIGNLVPTERHFHIAGMAFSPDGRLLAVGQHNQSVVTIWDVVGRKTLCRLKLSAPNARNDYNPNESVSNVAFTNDGRILLVAYANGWVQGWETSVWGLRYKYKIADANANVCIAPTGPYFAISGIDQKSQKTIHVFDSKTAAGYALPANQLGPDRILLDLQTNDSAHAFECIGELVSNPRSTLAILDKRLATVDPVKPAVIEDYVRDLDSERFETRRQAKQGLTKLGEVARPTLIRILANKPSLEAATQIRDLLDSIDNRPLGERVQIYRAVEVLESIGSTESRRILKRIAGGDDAALLTREAKAALARWTAVRSCGR